MWHCSVHSRILYFKLRMRSSVLSWLMPSGNNEHDAFVESIQLYCSLGFVVLGKCDIWRIYVLIWKACLPFTDLLVCKNTLHQLDDFYVTIRLNGNCPCCSEWVCCLIPGRHIQTSVMSSSRYEAQSALRCQLCTGSHSTSLPPLCRTCLNDVHALKHINTLVTQTTVALIGPFPPTHWCCISYCFGTNMGQRFQKYVRSCKDHQRATNSWIDVVSNIGLNLAEPQGRIHSECFQ